MPWLAAVPAVLGSVAGAIGTGAAAAGSALASGAGAVGSALGSGAGAVGSALGSGASAAGSALGSVASGAGEAIGSGLSTLGQGAGKVASTIGETAGKVGSTIGDATSSLGSSISQGASKLGGSVDDLISSAVVNSHPSVKGVDVSKGLGYPSAETPGTGSYDKLLKDLTKEMPGGSSTKSSTTTPVGGSVPALNMKPDQVLQAQALTDLVRQYTGGR